MPAIQMTSVTVSPTLHVQWSGPPPQFFDANNKTGFPGVKVPLRLATALARMEEIPLEVDAGTEVADLPMSAADAVRELFAAQVRLGSPAVLGTAEFTLLGDPQPTDIRRPETWKPNLEGATALAFQVGVQDRDESGGLSADSAPRAYELTYSNGLLKAQLWVCFNLLQEVVP